MATAVGRMRYRILDRELLAVLLQWRITAEFRGSLNAAARAAGLSQPALYRLVNGVAKSRGKARELSVSEVSPLVFQRLTQFLGASMDKSVFLHPAGVTANNLFRFWIIESHRRFVDGSLAANGVISGSPEAPWRGRALEFQSLVERIAKEVPDVATEIRGSIKPDSEFVDERWVLKLLGGSFPDGRSLQAGIADGRCLVAVERTIAPLVDVNASGWIERRHTELSTEEFRQFIRAGWKRESILLKRDSDARRSQRVLSIALSKEAASPSFDSQVLAALREFRNASPATGKFFRGGMRKVGTR